jgi:hypothetical protein
MAEIREMVERHYPSMKMGQTPRWLIPVARRGKGTRSTAAVVITLVGNVTVETLGVEKLYLENRSCRIEEYLSYGPNTQCQRCQKYGHHTKRCAAPTAICAVCAEPHPTISHVCTVPRCRQGPMCVHPPLRCTNCHSPHRASDKNCPARTKAGIQARPSRRRRNRRNKPVKLPQPPVDDGESSDDKDELSDDKVIDPRTETPRPDPSTSRSGSPEPESNVVPLDIPCPDASMTDATGL